jgi:hypothetical protein
LRETMVTPAAQPSNAKPIAGPVEFDILVPGPPEKIHLGVYGRAGSGKTRLMATAPGLGVIPLQRKTRTTVEQVIKDLYPNRKILWPKNADEFYKYRDPMELSQMNRDQSKAFHHQLLDRIKQAAWTLLEHPGCRSIGIDPFYMFYDIVLAKHYGKSRRFIRSAEEKVAYGPPNDETREFITSLQDKNLILTTEAGEAYQGKLALGYDEAKGYKSIGYDVNCLVETRHSAAEGFWLDVRMCQDRAELQGVAGQRLLVEKTVEFKFLACEIRPSSSLGDWE